MPRHYKVQDRFFKKAKEEGYRARSAYKLEAILQRFHLVKPGDRVLDCGAAPGSFLQLIRKTVGAKGLVVGVDLQAIEPFAETNVKTYTGDVFDDALIEKIMTENQVSRFDVITSDLAPSTTGIKSVDAGRSHELNMQVLKLARRWLRPGGHVLVKVFPGVDHEKLIAEFKKGFKKATSYRPEAIRDTSREVYWVGIGKY